MLLYPPGSHSGIIILKTRALPSELIRNLLIDFLSEVNGGEIYGSLIILEKRRYRIRRENG